MPTAVLVLALVLGAVVLVGLLSGIAIVTRSLVQTSRAVSELAGRLANAEDRLAELHGVLPEIGEDLSDVGAMLAEHRMDAPPAQTGDARTDVPTTDLQAGT